MRQLRRLRKTQRISLVLTGAVFGIFAISAAIIGLLVPRSAQRPLVTLYMEADCSTCERYAKYLRDRRFRVEVVAGPQVTHVQARLNLPPVFRARHIGLVEQIFIEGHVPSREIYTLLAPRNRGRARGIVVPGTPRGAPGLESLFPEPYTVYWVRDRGLVQPRNTYNHGFH